MQVVFYHQGNYDKFVTDISWNYFLHFVYYNDTCLNKIE